ncbi:FLYWCH zinc finger domain-containing protein [Phthorimaea operculella]|nr:FLYWCH zinc finger domain-containing protein [Phthorimaea operculella]
MDDVHAHIGAEILDSNKSPSTSTPDVPASIIEWVKSESGGKLALVGGYTFSSNSAASRNSWRCTRRGDCKARFVLDKGSEAMLKSNMEHNHAPNNYYIKNGVYIKLLS